LLQAQVEPHFLFNTLANVQALVDGGSPHASKVLENLIAYLRAAVPRMRDRATTLGQELELVRAYLELMRTRMPDRLVFRLNADAGADGYECPPMTLLTLVENSVRHGIDPSEEGGTIEVDVAARDGRCIVRVTDSGVGLAGQSNGLGTGLAALRERLQLAFDGDAQLRLTEVEPHGVRAELDFPARPGA
jgi:LytS/YehU family sensor histidine kinase